MGRTEILCSKNAYCYAGRSLGAPRELKIWLKGFQIKYFGMVSFKWESIWMQFLTLLSSFSLWTNSTYNQLRGKTVKIPNNCKKIDSNSFKWDDTLWSVCCRSNLEKRKKMVRTLFRPYRNVLFCYQVIHKY